MLHWASSFARMALDAPALSYTPFLGAAAALVFWVFAGLWIGALATHVLGRLPQGGYSSERAALMLGLIAAAGLGAACAAEALLDF
jgi:hypothetical protein